ncbi:MAG: TonB-dependent receptor, partial [Prolixibacteraceae bacterium]|nr:TonB-dependent receptor [Prolixibacteraceae bacterium]
DQLVLTGQLNNVGNPIMINAGDSYRAGIELQAGIKIFHNIEWHGNATFSKNRINNFTEYVDNWDTGRQEPFELKTTVIAFSPEITGNSQLLFEPAENLELQLISSFVSKQYIDNTSSEDRTIDPYFINTLQAGYSFKSELFENITLNLMINNVFNEEYESNAWVYSYIFNGARHKMDGYFPQAGRHFMFGIDIKF